MTKLTEKLYAAYVDIAFAAKAHDITPAKAPWPPACRPLSSSSWGRSTRRLTNPRRRRCATD